MIFSKVTVKKIAKEVWDHFQNRYRDESKAIRLAALDTYSYFTEDYEREKWEDYVNRSRPHESKPLSMHAEWQNNKPIRKDIIKPKREDHRVVAIHRPYRKDYERIY